MHTLDRVGREVAIDGNRADRCAQSIPFVHVLRSRSLGTLLREVLLEKQIKVPESRSATKTGRAEDALRIAPSVYFFAGHAFPTKEAQVACVATAKSLRENREGLGIVVSPFDSGGLHSDQLELDWQRYNDGDAEKLGYLRRHTAVFDDFQKYFAGFLEQFFKNPEDYWSFPSNNIDGAALGPASDKRNWAFEIRCEGRANVADADWFLDDEMHREYAWQLADVGIDPIRVHYVSIPTEVASAAEAFARQQSLMTVEDFAK